MKNPPVSHRLGSVVLLAAVWAHPCSALADPIQPKLDAQVESNGVDGFAIIDHSTTTGSSISAGRSGSHGSAFATATYGSISLSVDSVSGSDTVGGNYSSGGVDFGDGTVGTNYWIDALTIYSSDPAMNDSHAAGTVQITYTLQGTFTELGNTSSTASGWDLITTAQLMRYSTFTSGPDISTIHTIVDTVGFNYGTPFQIQGGIDAHAVTNDSPNAHVSGSITLAQAGLQVLSGSAPVDFTSTSNTGSAAGKVVSNGGGYSGFTLTNTSAYGHGTTLSILGGSATTDTALGGSFISMPAGGDNIGDAVSFSGTGTDKFVLELSYDPAAVTGDPNDLLLMWLNPNTQSWMNVVDGNSDGGATSQAISGAYDPANDFVLGDYGVDTTNHEVWAVIDHNSTFAVGDAVPEPGAWTALASGLAVLVLWRRRR